MQLDVVMTALSFVLLGLAAKEVGKGVRWIGFPVLSGFLCTGILAGPYGLGFLQASAVRQLQILDEFALVFIAFAAGSELGLQALRRSFGVIVAIIIGQCGVMLVLGTMAFFLLSGSIPFLTGMTMAGILSVSLLGGTIMAARSPSSAYAIIKELRAQGPFTQVILGVTVLMDTVVIILFAIGVSTADVLIQGAPLHGGIVLLVTGEILLDILMGYLIAQFLRGLLALPLWPHAKTGLIMLTGYVIFSLSSALHTVSIGPLSVKIFSEPLLIGLVTGFVVANFTRYAAELRHLLEEASPLVLLSFFTLVGLSLEVQMLVSTWAVALILMVVRFIGLYLGSFVSSLVVKTHRPVFLSMSFITQAGVSVGLAKQVAVEFPAWGQDFATLVIAVIVMNQIIGPPFLKWSLRLVGEAHPRAATHDPESVRQAVIFGVDEQSLALARQLKAHHWEVTLADIEAGRIERLVWPGVQVHLLASLSKEQLQDLNVAQADAIVAMLDDEANYHICALAYEEFGTAIMVARLYDRQHLDRFNSLGVTVVNPHTALMHLLDHCVRSPSATALLLGQAMDQDVIEVTLRNPTLHGAALRDLRLPVDTLILTARRHGQLLLSHGYTRLELGDAVTVVGPPHSLEEVKWYFEP